MTDRRVCLDLSAAILEAIEAALAGDVHEQTELGEVTGR